MNSTNAAPTSTAGSDAAPPITSPASSRIESVTGNVPGVTMKLRIAYSPPATPAKKAEAPNASVL